MSFLFNGHIADLLPTLKWRHFGVGALQAYLFEGEGIEQRLHIWHPLLVRDGIEGQGDCHDHRFSFKSEVLCGGIGHEEWSIRPNPGGDWDVYEVENARAARERTGSNDGRCAIVMRCFAEPCALLTRVEGQSYEFKRGRFHRSFALGTTVTLLTKFDQVSHQPARILCPHGKPLVHAFGEPLPDATVQRVLLDAQEALYR